MAAALPFLPGALHVQDLAWGALCGVIGAAAVGLLYRGLAIGTMGVVSPITAVLSALLPIGFGLARRQFPTTEAWTGIGLALIAVTAIAAQPPASTDRATRGLAEALGAGMLFGLFFIVLAQTRSDAGLFPLVGARAASLVVFLMVALVLRANIVPSHNALAATAAGGVFDMLANVLYLLAAHRGMLAIVAVLTALYPASTVALAALVLHERLRALQWVGVGVALVAVGLLTAGR